MQGGNGGLRGPTAVPLGGSIRVEVGPNDASVEISTPSEGKAESYPVTPGKEAVIPVPDVPAGTVVVVTVGDGLRAHAILIEVVAPE